MSKYIVVKQFDAYICSLGRIVINPGAEFEMHGTKVYFTNSKNYLPYEAAK